MTALSPIASQPRLSISVASIGVAVAVLVQLVAVVSFGASLATRVEAVESDAAPIRAGKLAVLEERMQRVQTDVAWIRAKLDEDGR